jgi:hypothetical protein
MVKQVRTLWIGAALLAALGLVQAPEAAGPDVTGTWNVAVSADGPHGQMTATLTLAQDGQKVTGKLAAHGIEHALSGEFADGALALEATGVPADKAISLRARLQDDGTLSGYLSGPMGDVKWTASRRQERQ